MTDYTRSTRTVRIKSTDTKFFADVEILMSVAFKLPNGFEICYNITAPTMPLIVDDTKDGNQKAGDRTTTRSSHMQRLTGLTKALDPVTGKVVDNSAQFIDVEVLDSFTMTGPNNTEHVINCPPADATEQIVDGVDAGLDGFWGYDPSTAGSSQLTLVPGSAGDQTRCGHAVRYTQQITGATKAPFDLPSNCAYGIITDCMTFDGPIDSDGMPYVSEAAPSTADDLSVDDESTPQWGHLYGMTFDSPDQVIHGALQPDAACIDLTEYVIDPDTGQQVPPPPDPAVDLNIYVYWPGVGNAVGGAPPVGTATAGPWLGGGFGGDQETSASPPPAIDMGPLWWIRQLSAAQNVWFWYLSPVQQPLAVSFFGAPPEGIIPTWGFRGFTLLPSFPVAWILSENFPIIPMGTYGAPDLETAAGGYTAIGGDGSITVNWAGVGYPDGGWGVNTEFDDVEALVNAGTGGFLSTYYMPYGALDMLGPTSAELIAKLRATGGRVESYTDFAGPPPNIWELVGLKQPPLQDPTKVWDPNTNPHGQPSIALAKQCAQTFALKWNEVATAHNNQIKAAFVTGGTPTDFPFVPPPAWSWAKPYGGNTVPTAMMFSNGWIPTPAVPEETVPMTLPTIAVGQLNPSVWDVSPTIKNGTPPVLRATGLP